MDLVFVIVVIIRKIILAELVIKIVIIVSGQVIRNVLLATQHKSSTLTLAFALTAVINPQTPAYSALLHAYHVQVPIPAPHAILHSPS